MDGLQREHAAIRDTARASQKKFKAVQGSKVRKIAHDCYTFAIDDDRGRAFALEA
jgi:hypothetical protein